MSSRVDEIETAMYSVIHDVPSVETALILKVSFKLVIYVLYYLLETKTNVGKKYYDKHHFWTVW